jgi:hypothetical protein
MVSKGEKQIGPERTVTKSHKNELQIYVFPYKFEVYIFVRFV